MTKLNQIICDCKNNQRCLIKLNKINCGCCKCRHLCSFFWNTFCPFKYQFKSFDNQNNLKFKAFVDGSNYLPYQICFVNHLM